MTFEQSLAYLGQARRMGMKLGLETMQELVGALGHPERELAFLHIAGTNGKGSTAAFSESLWRGQGRRMGLFTSPHLIDVRERVQIDRVPVSRELWCAGMGAVAQAVAHLQPRGVEPSFFELVTALALWCFREAEVEGVVWETGLGGRLDATNIVVPRVSVITSIGLDHQQYLGQTLEAIAAEKAGIIKPGVPVVSGVEAEGPAQVVAAVAARQAAPFWRLGHELPLPEVRDGCWRWEDRGIKLGLRGEHQARNAVLALQAVALASGQMPHASLLEQTQWPGRFQRVWHDPCVVVDGAHNPEATACLVRTWEAEFPGRRYELVWAVASDKDAGTMARMLQMRASRVHLVQLSSERATAPQSLRACFTGVESVFWDSVRTWWEEARGRAGTFFLVTGSLFLAGELLAVLEGREADWHLNEWLQPPAKKGQV